MARQKANAPASGVELVQQLALQHSADLLAGAAACRAAAELGARHGREVPSDAVDAAIERFGHWLRDAVSSVRPGRVR